MGDLATYVAETSYGNKEKRAIESVFQDWGKGAALRRVAQPREVGEACAFLFSDRSSFVTGDDGRWRHHTWLLRICPTALAATAVPQSCVRFLPKIHFRNDFIAPIFVSEQGTARFEIPSLPGVARIPLNELAAEIKLHKDLGIKSVLLFPVNGTDKKSLDGRESYNPEGLVQRAIRETKKACP